MPRKLEFQVVHVSGYDNEHSPRELEIHSPITRGWQSQKFCVYPQEVVLKLRGPAKLRKLQILSHQYLVASKVEIFAGLSSTGQVPSLINCKFKRLGYVSLADNEASDYKTRELKSVNLDVECHFVKFVIHKNHVNRHNLYNQVNIIAINLIGDPLDEIYSETKQEDKIENRTAEVIQEFVKGVNTQDLQKDILPSVRPDYISPLDDLAFDIYQDPETAQLIRRLEKKKQDAVLEERFDYAKKLKQAMADLHKVGERLGKLEVEKRRAIELEDYDSAKAKKLQCDEYRLHVYKQLDLHDLLELNKQEPRKQQSPAVFMAPQQQQSSVQHETRTQRANSPESPMLPQLINAGKTSFIHNSPVQRDSPVLERIKNQEPSEASPKAVDHDERVIPALKNKVHFSEETEQQQESDTNHDEKPQELSDKDEAEAGPIIDVYGMKLVQLAYSKSWKHRQEAMETVLNEIKSDTPKLIFESDAKAIVRATSLLMKRLLLENVFSIFLEVAKIEKLLLEDYIPRKKLGKSEYTFVLDKTFIPLLNRSGDMAVRTKDTAMNLILEIAVIKDVKALGIIPEQLVQPIKSKGKIPWRQFKGRLEVIHKLLGILDVDKPGGFTTGGVMKIVMTALAHSNKEVREVAVEILLELYKKVGGPVRTYLPPDEPATRKNPLYGKIFDGFDKVDGKPTKAERKKQAKLDQEAVDKAKKDEIEALQAQLQALRAVADGINKEGEPAHGDAQNPTEPKGEENVNIEKMCIFCGEHNDKFNEESLDVHYWKSCPMLKRCNNCTQVVEICNLNDHLLSECDKKADFKKCPRCQEAMLKTELDNHLKVKTCPATRNDKPLNRCPLCKEKVSQGDEGWKKHLMNDCKANVKRLQQQKQSGKTGSVPATLKKGGNLQSQEGVKRRTSKALAKNNKVNDVK